MYRIVFCIVFSIDDIMLATIKSYYSCLHTICQYRTSFINIYISFNLTAHLFSTFFCSAGHWLYIFANVFIFILRCSAAAGFSDGLIVGAKLTLSNPLLCLRKIKHCWLRVSVCVCPVCAHSMIEHFYRNEQMLSQDVRTYLHTCDIYLFFCVYFRSTHLQRECEWVCSVFGHCIRFIVIMCLVEDDDDKKKRHSFSSRMCLTYCKCEPNTLTTAHDPGTCLPERAKNKNAKIEEWKKMELDLIKICINALCIVVRTCIGAVLKNLRTFKRTVRAFRSANLHIRCEKKKTARAVGEVIGIRVDSRRQ